MEYEPLLLIKTYRARVLQVAHNIPLSGHLGKDKTTQRTLRRFYWPTVYRAVAEYVSSCESRQQTTKPTKHKAPLQPLPIMGEPFDRIAMDIVGLLPRTRFNRKLKSMLKGVFSEDKREWDELVPYVLFAYREVPQASTGFSPFKLIMARDVRGPLDELQEGWTSTRGKDDSIVEYVTRVKERMHLAKEDAPSQRGRAGEHAPGPTDTEVMV